VILIK